MQTRSNQTSDKPSPHEERDEGPAAFPLSRISFQEQQFVYLTVGFKKPLRVQRLAKVLPAFLVLTLSTLPAGKFVWLRGHVPQINPEAKNHAQNCEKDGRGNRHISHLIAFIVAMSETQAIQESTEESGNESRVTAPC